MLEKEFISKSDLGKYLSGKIILENVSWKKRSFSRKMNFWKNISENNFLVFLRKTPPLILIKDLLIFPNSSFRNQTNMWFVGF